jgi:hypothetical protein
LRLGTVNLPSRERSGTERAAYTPSPASGWRDRRPSRVGAKINLSPHPGPHEMMRSIPSAKGRAHEAFCAWGGVRCPPFPLHASGTVEAPEARHGGAILRALMPPKGSAKGRRGSATVGPVREIGHRDRGGLEVGRPARSRLAFVSGPRRAGAKTTAAGAL